MRHQKVNSSIVSKGAVNSFNEMFSLAKMFSQAVMHMVITKTMDESQTGTDESRRVTDEYRRVTDEYSRVTDEYRRVTD